MAPRSTTASVALACALGVAATACDEPRKKPAIERGDTARPRPPLVELAIGAVKRATVAAVQLQKAPTDRSAYLTIRREVAMAEPFLRKAQRGREALLGPSRSVEDAGGALGLLDTALAQGDAKARDAQLTRVIGALRLLDHELVLHGVPPAQALQALSDTAFDLGLRLAEANPGVPLRPDAVLADLRGTTAALRQGVAALGRWPDLAEARRAVESALAPIEEALGGVTDAHALRRRAALVRATGPLGVAVRRFAIAAGTTPELPFAARQPQANNGAGEPITALTLPAPRAALGDGDPKKMAALGRRLFLEPALSKDGKRSCVGCHLPERGYGGAPSPPASHVTDRHPPSLLYTSLHATQLWDGRFASTERQTAQRVHADGEVGLEPGTLVPTLEAVKGADYEAAFAAAFSEGGLTEAHVAQALLAFEIEALVPASSRFDRFARGEADLTDADHAGFDLFVGKARCARCHLPPSFAGVRPPDFSETIYARLVLPATPEAKALDDDPGRFDVTQAKQDQHAFKTPTVRNAGATAPYFHHGAYPDLDAVLDFYNRGGGAGLEASGRDPDVLPLKLSDAELAQLKAFLSETLRDDDWIRLQE